MNLSKASLLGLATVFYLQSCKTVQEQVSAEVRPTTAYLSSYYDTLAVQSAVVVYNVINANENNTLLVGSYIDPVLGKVRANAFAQFSLAGNLNTLGPNTKFKDLRLKVNFNSTRSEVSTRSFYNQYAYGKSDIAQRVYLYRLSENINPAIVYKTLDSIPYSDFLGIFDIISGNSVDIPLSTILGQEFIDNVSLFDPASNFYSQFKGLAFIAEDADAAVWRITSARMVLYYYNFYGLNNIRVDDSLVIQIDRNVRVKFTQLKRDYSLSPILAAFSSANNYDSVPQSALNDYMYIQAMTGIHSRIKFIGLSDLIQRHGGKILVNRAELVIEPDTSVSDAFALPRTLYAYELHADGTILNGNKLLQRDEFNIFGTANPQYRTLVENKKYVFVITTYIQAIIDGRMQNNGLMIGAASDLSQTGIAMAEISRLQLQNLNFGKRNIQLRLFYSVYK